MKYITVFNFILTTVGICISTATEIFYVLPDNFTTVSCPSQPCATLSQYWLHNGTLPVVSNVKYHFLPGEHYVPANMVLQNLHNFTIMGAVSNLSSPVVLVCSHVQSYVIDIKNSYFVTIENVWFKHYGTLFNKKMTYTNLQMYCCFSCRIENVIFLQYGLKANNLIGDTYLHNIKVGITQFVEVCCQKISLRYDTCSSWSEYNNQMHVLTINQLLINDQKKHFIFWDINNVGLRISLKYLMYNLEVLLTNSHFSSMDRTAIYIEGGCSSKVKQFFITNCTFTSIRYHNVIDISLKPVNMVINFLNITFYDNHYIQVKIRIRHLINTIGCKLVNTNSIVPAVINISIMKFLISDCSYCDDLLVIHNEVATFDKVNVFFKFLNFTKNSIVGDVIWLKKVNVHFAGPFDVYENRFKSSIMRFQSCDVLFSGTVIIHKNQCSEVISVDTHIKILEYTNISIVKNIYSNSLLAVVSTEEYNQPYPLCLFQYIALNSSRLTADLPSHYNITLYHNYHVNISKASLYNSKICSVSVSYCDFITHCKWLPSAAFYNYSPTIINKQIIQSDDQNYNYDHNHICYCSQNKVINCSIDKLGAVYPGQMLQVNFCKKCGNDENTSTVLYADIHNTNLPNSICKIAHHSQLISVIGDNSNTVNYTIVSNILNNNRCKLFLTASPFLNKVYDIFYVQLLPCPVGFTLQDGICDCDPVLSEYADKCLIDNSAIQRPDNTWITALKQTSNNTKYLISDCPMDYCLPYSSNVNLLHPDEQCQFNRTGMLCSQCQQHLSMVFGSSRCMECTNLYILISIIVVGAGIILVALLYLLNLTVTVGTITGIVFYANIISINDSVFLANNNVLKPYKAFISFVNLDLGIETCFYNGMDMYVKIWLLFFFPFFLIFNAFIIIIASRHSTRILRLTFSRSLPVLATLFLFSYNGVLRTVLTVLFSYSTITHLPSGHKQIVWSIDASVPLFGLKFTILFITCLVLFLLLIPFNIVLLFTRKLLQYKIINRFKPLLDAFQASHKDKYYNWVAVQITLRSIFFALYGFPIKLRLLLATMILVLFTGCHGYIHPNKNKLVNLQELILLINLTMLYAASYQCSDSTFTAITNVMISLAIIQFIIIVLYHFLTYTCHCNIVIMLQTAKDKIMRYNLKKNESQNTLCMLNIPERTYNYTEYQDGLVSDDFK